jgi:hypothetical protein
MFLFVLGFIIRTVGSILLLPVIWFSSVSAENLAFGTVMGRVRTVFFAVMWSFALLLVVGRMMLLHSLSCRTLVVRTAVVFSSDVILAFCAFADFDEFFCSRSLRVESLIDHEFAVRLGSSRHQNVHEVWL